MNWAPGAGIFLILLAGPVPTVSVEPLPPDPVAEFMRDREPTSIPASSVLDGLSRSARALQRESGSAQAVTLDEGTTRNAIVLGRVGGVPFTVDDIASRDATRSRTSTAFQSFEPDLESFFSALLVGASAPVGMRATGGELEKLLTRTTVYTTSDSLSQRANISDENAQGGAALLANGIPLDPHALVGREAVAKGTTDTRELAEASQADPRLTQEVIFDARVALTASTLAPVGGGTVHAFDLSDASLQVSDRGESGRSVSLPEDNVIAGLALHANGIPIEGEDLLNVDERASVQRVKVVEAAFDREAVFGALLLGATATL